MRSFASIALMSVAAVHADPSVVTTPLGDVVGIVGNTYRVFEGVPYAQPPVGPLRWRDPLPVQPWAPKTWIATEEAPGCRQVCVDNEPPHICPIRQSEDCLYLNVWTPVPVPTNAPVIIFWHGGNFKDGYAGGLDNTGGLLYDGRSFVSTTGSIIVVANYRLGNLGFLYLGENTAETSIHGNYGLRDQIQSLEWVKANIQYFGGDPTRVTVMGQSAGAMSISCHLSRPQSTGLFNGAIMMSNPFGEAYRQPSSAQALASAFANFTGCPSSMSNVTAIEECLRATDGDVLVAAQKLAEVDLLPDLNDLLQIVVAWGPTIGTAFLPQRPLEAFQAGNVLDLPIMIGTTSEEAVIFVYEALNMTLSLLEYEILGPVLLGADVYKSSLSPDLYPLPSPPPADGDYRLFAAGVFTDGLFLCATRNATESMQAAQPYRRSPVYVWQYSHEMSWATGMWGANFTECDTHVCHGSDLPEWWLPQQEALGSNYTQQELDLGHDMEWYYANFAATGNPGSGSPERPFTWPAYSVAGGRSTLNLEVEPQGKSIISGLRSHWCDWWDNVAGYQVY